VWTWLLLPYAQLLAKTILNEKQLKQELTALAEPFRRNLRNGRCASVAEIWDGGLPGQPAPDIPKGAPAQAWSVAALVAIENMIRNL
jgi:glycogen debranching enzyme